jgi:hypothetical protein
MLFGMFVSDSPLESLRKKLNWYIAGAKNRLNCCIAVEFFPIWINEKTALLYINTVYKCSLKCTEYNWLVRTKKKFETMWCGKIWRNVYDKQKIQVFFLLCMIYFHFVIWKLSHFTRGYRHSWHIYFPVLREKKKNLNIFYVSLIIFYKLFYLLHSMLTKPYSRN